MTPVMDQPPNEMARHLMCVDDLDNASRIEETELEQCKDQGNTYEIWSLRFIRADLLRLRGRTEQALEYLTAKESEHPPDSCDIRSHAGLKSQQGYCLGLLGKCAQSHALLQDAGQMAHDAALPELQCEVWQRQAVIYYLQQDYSSSDRHFHLILDTSERIGGWYFRAIALWGIGKNMMIQNHHASALPWLTDSLALFESAGAKLWMATVWSELAVCYLGLGDDRKALELLENSLKVNQEAGIPLNYLIVLANIGNVHLHRGDPLTAIAFYRRALALAHEIKDPVSIEKWSFNIRLAYARLRQAVDQLNSQTA
jgi:tetratricopeptide (TPR) repeat protein